jgi:four helix bundle protein
MRLVTAIYVATQKFPREEVFGLSSQMRRAAVSVVSNIAEGSGRFSDGEFRQFLSQSRGSLLELETQLLIARELNCISGPDAEVLLQSTDEISRMLSGLRNTIHPKSSAPGKASDVSLESHGNAATRNSSKSRSSRLATRDSRLSHNS